MRDPLSSHRFVLSVIGDVAGVVGFVALERGIWLIYRPAAYVAAGVLLLAISWFWPDR